MTRFCQAFASLPGCIAWVPAPQILWARPQMERSDDQLGVCPNRWAQEDLLELEDVFEHLAERPVCLR